MRILEAIIGAFSSIGRFGIFTFRFLKVMFRHRPPIRRTFNEAYRIGVLSLPVLLTIAAFVGTNLTMQGYHAFKPMGGERMVGMFVGLAGVRELAPIIAAAMIAAKVGTEMASEIAVMRIREEIDALSVMAVNPYWYLVTPRILATILVLPALTILSIYGMLVASYMVAVYQLGLNGQEFIEFLQRGATVTDLAYGAMKSIVFGIIICLVSCYCGFNSKPGPRGVGSATNSAVVTSAVVCVMVNYIISELVYGR
jgi:phospholipid/cholesterol/gamma-HCH transport system permease protein